MLKHLLRLAVAFALGILTYYASYSILSPYSEHLAALAAYGLLFSVPLPMILAFYGKVKWAGRLFVGLWLAYASAITALIAWVTLGAFPTEASALILVTGGLQLLSLRRKSEEEPEVQPVLEFEAKLTAEPKVQPMKTKEAEFELEEPRPMMEERAEEARVDLDELVNTLDGLDCKILLKLLTAGPVSSKKTLQNATGATYRRVLSSTKRIQEANLIEIRREVIRGRKGAVIRHSIDIASNAEKKHLEPLVRQRLEKLGKWGIT